MVAGRVGIPRFPWRWRKHALRRSHPVPHTPLRPGGVSCTHAKPRNEERFRGGLVLKAHKLSYHSTLGSRVIKKKREQSPPQRLHTLNSDPRRPRPPPRRTTSTGKIGWTGTTLHPTPYTLHPTPYTLHPAPHTLHPTAYSLHPATLNPKPQTSNSTSPTPHPTPNTPRKNSHGREVIPFGGSSLIRN